MAERVSWRDRWHARRARLAEEAAERVRLAQDAGTRVPSTMREYYGKVVWGPGRVVVKQTLFSFIGALSGIWFLLGVLSTKAANKIINLGLPKAVYYIPFGAVVLYGLLKANFENFREKEDEVIALEARMHRLQEPLRLYRDRRRASRELTALLLHSMRREGDLAEIVLRETRPESGQAGFAKEEDRQEALARHRAGVDQWVEQLKTLLAPYGAFDPVVLEPLEDVEFDFDALLNVVRTRNQILQQALWAHHDLWAGPWDDLGD